MLEGRGGGLQMDGFSLPYFLYFESNPTNYFHYNGDSFFFTKEIFFYITFLFHKIILDKKILKLNSITALEYNLIVI